MKLKQARIREFWSILDSNAFSIGDRTCLVGKNEAGKTALLKALYRLNPINAPEGRFAATDDYPRADVTQYEKDVAEGVRQHAHVVEAVFELEQEELKPIIEFLGPNVLARSELKLLKGYENKLDFELFINEKAAGTFLLQKANLDADVAQNGTDWADLQELQAVLGKMAQKKEAAYQAACTTANALEDPDQKTKALAEAQVLHESAASKQLRAEIDPLVATGLGKYIYKKYLHEGIPQFVYFDEYYQMRGCENIQALQTRQANGTLGPSDHPLLGLIALAGLKLPDMLNVSRTRELKNRLEGASNHLTKQIIKYWSQNRYLRLEFDVREAKPGDPEHMRSGTNIWGFVDDTKTFCYNRFGLTVSRVCVVFFILGMVLATTK